VTSPARGSASARRPRLRPRSLRPQSSSLGSLPTAHAASSTPRRSPPSDLLALDAAQLRASRICRCRPFPLPEGRRVPPAPPWSPPSARPGSWTPPPPPTFLMLPRTPPSTRTTVVPRPPLTPSSSSPPRRCRRSAGRSAGDRFIAFVSRRRKLVPREGTQHATTNQSIPVPCYVVCFR
jgi:hypothetical protein